MRLKPLIIAVLALPACSSDLVEGLDRGSPDAEIADRGNAPADLGFEDAPPVDAGTLDADPPDVMIEDRPATDGGPPCNGNTTPPAPICAGAWCRLDPTFAPEDLLAVAASDGCFALAVGAAGTALRWDGEYWRETDSGEQSGLRDVWVDSATLAYAVTADRVLRWDGNVWSPEPVRTTMPLHAVWGSSADDVWVGGDNGTVFHLSNNTWTSSTSTDQASWRDIDGTGPDDLWFAAADNRLGRWNGARWSRDPRFLGGKIAAATPGTLWATSGPSYFDGQSWRVVSIPQAYSEVTAVWADRTTNAAFILNPFNDPITPITIWLATYDGNSWDFHSTSSQGPLYLGGAAADDLWLAGDEGHISHFDGATVTRVRSVASFGRGQCAALGAGDVVCNKPAINQKASSGIARWNNGWTHQGLPAAVPIMSPPRAIWAAGPNDIWAQHSELFHYDGNSWTAVAAPVIADVIGGVGTNDLWACSGGLWMRKRASWAAVTSPGPCAKMIWGAANNDVWAVGEDGQALHFTGAWQTTRTGTISDLLAVHGSGSNDVWAVGASGTILHWDGGAWSMVPSPTQVNLHSVAAVSPIRAYAAGGAGTMIEWNGVEWSLVPAITRGNIDLVWASGARAWAISGTHLFERR